MNVEVNYIAVLLAGVASMVVGFLWYSQMLFGNQWIKLMGWNKQSMEKGKADMQMTYVVSFVLSLVTAYVLTHVMAMSSNFFNYAPLQTGLMSAFWMWLGFVMPVQVTGELYTGKNWNLFGINTGYQLVSLLVMGVVLAMMG